MASPSRRSQRESIRPAPSRRPLIALVGPRVGPPGIRVQRRGFAASPRPRGGPSTASPHGFQSLPPSGAARLTKGAAEPSLEPTPKSRYRRMPRQMASRTGRAPPRPSAVRAQAAAPLDLRTLSIPELVALAFAKDAFVPEAEVKAWYAALAPQDQERPFQWLWDRVRTAHAPRRVLKRHVLPLVVGRPRGRRPKRVP
jgi:hypothetical protein